MAGPRDDGAFGCQSCPPGEEVGAAISARAADGRSKASGRRLQAEEDKLHRHLVRAAREREPAAWETFEVFKPVSEGAPPKAILDTRWVLLWKMAAGAKKVKARMVA